MVAILISSFISLNLSYEKFHISTCSNLAPKIYEINIYKMAKHPTERVGSGSPSQVEAEFAFIVCTEFILCQNGKHLHIFVQAVFSIHFKHQVSFMKWPVCVCVEGWGE